QLVEIFLQLAADPQIDSEQKAQLKKMVATKGELSFYDVFTKPEFSLLSWAAMLFAEAPGGA
ncbi:hypothetical protein FK513_29635, partial [Klebsiella pneumoniae]|uniref:YlaC family protein n=1 Tax=Klebsiella pneumoniae TaxID=573 RepID=UPI00272E8B8A